MAVFVVNITDGGTFASLDVGLGRGPKGDGFTGGSFNAATGQITFTSNDGIGFTTGDVRVDLGAPGPIGDVTPDTGNFTSVAITGELTAAQYNSTEALPDIKPSLNLDFANTKALDPRITYTRGSTATYYDGKTLAKAEENLLEYSQEFDNAAWVKQRATVTANADTAPDGTTTADALLQATGQTTFGNAVRAIPVAAGDHVFSVFAKPNGKNFIILQEQMSDGAIRRTWFNVSTGAVGTTDANHTATITASTNGYYRCSILFTVDAARTASASGFGLADTDGSTTVADDGNGLYLWGAQLEQRSALTDYTATTTQPITNYTPALQTAASGEPRFDHDPITGESKGFLIEEQRTNLLTYSEQFDNAAWTKTRSSITANVVVAPDGTLTGDKLIANTESSTSHYAFDGASLTSGVTYAFSVYAKAAEWDAIRLQVFAGTGAIFDLSTGTVSYEQNVDSATIIDAGNGWYRCTLLYTADITSNYNFGFYPYQSGFVINETYTGDGYSGIYVWGAQLEQGSFPTSYIPTVASQVTRSPDAASMTGTNFSSWYRQDEGTVFVNYSAPTLGGTTADPYVVGFSGGDASTTTPRISLRLEDSNDSAALQVIDASGGAQANVQGGIPVDVTNARVSATYAVDDFAISVFDNTVATDTSGYVAAGGITHLHLGHHTGSLNGHIKKLAYYPKRLSNATLQALTEE